MKSKRCNVNDVDDDEVGGRRPPGEDQGPTAAREEDGVSRAGQEVGPGKTQTTRRQQGRSTVQFETWKCTSCLGLSDELYGCKLKQELFALVLFEV